MSEAAIIKKYNVKIFKPEGKPAGITVFLPGTLIPLKKFKSTYEVIVNQNQIVIAFNKLNPFTSTHDKMAEKVAGVVKEFRALEENANLLPGVKYNIVGHSLGGKVCLMVAAKFDIENVNRIIALDPVDDKPQELTGASPKTILSNSEAEEIHLFQSENGGDRTFFGLGPPLCPSDRNAAVVNELYPDQITSFEINKGAGHMSYLDTSTESVDEEARTVVHAMIRKVIF
jgi:pimeloyl-ACP methyl ester carboxylesterase